MLAATPSLRGAPRRLEQLRRSEPTHAFERGNNEHVGAHCKDRGWMQASRQLEALQCASVARDAHQLPALPKEQHAAVSERGTGHQAGFDVCIELDPAFALVLTSVRGPAQAKRKHDIAAPGQAEE